MRWKRLQWFCTGGAVVVRRAQGAGGLGGLGRADDRSHVARRAATDPSARIGTLVLGPGASANRAWVRGHRISRTQRGVAATLRHLGFDPRGVGDSSPVLCSGNQLDQLGQLIEAIDNQAAFDRVVAANRAFAEDCRRSSPVFDHIDTLQTVRDIAAIRAAVGDPQLSFMGVSYGTMMPTSTLRSSRTRCGRSWPTATWTTASAAAVMPLPRR
jgi:pimeloyl-ACP methyl ester carboxylesterase